METGQGHGPNRLKINLGAVMRGECTYISQVVILPTGLLRLTLYGSLQGVIEYKEPGQHGQGLYRTRSVYSLVQVLILVHRVVPSLF